MASNRSYSSWIETLVCFSVLKRNVKGSTNLQQQVARLSAKTYDLESNGHQLKANNVLYTFWLIFQCLQWETESICTKLILNSYRESGRNS